MNKIIDIVLRVQHQPRMCVSFRATNLLGEQLFSVADDEERAFRGFHSRRPPRGMDGDTTCDQGFP